MNMEEGVARIQRVHNGDAHQCDECFRRFRGPMRWNVMFYIHYDDGSWWCLCAEHLLLFPVLVQLAPILLEEVR